MYLCEVDILFEMIYSDLWYAYTERHLTGPGMGLGTGPGSIGSNIYAEMFI